MKLWCLFGNLIWARNQKPSKQFFFGGGSWQKIQSIDLCFSWIHHSLQFCKSHMSFKNLILELSASENALVPVSVKLYVFQSNSVMVFRVAQECNMIHFEKGLLRGSRPPLLFSFPIKREGLVKQGACTKKREHNYIN